MPRNVLLEMYVVDPDVSSFTGTFQSMKTRTGNPSSVVLTLLLYLLVGSVCAGFAGMNPDSLIHVPIAALLACAESITSAFNVHLFSGRYF